MMQLDRCHQAMADYFDAACKNAGDDKAVANWLLGDVSAYLNNEGIEIDAFPIKPENLGEMVALIKGGVLSSKLAKKVFAEMLKADKSPKVLVKELGLEQVSDEGAIAAIVDEVLAENPQSIADFKAGKDRAIGFLVGQVMKKSRGKANPGMVNKLLVEKCSKRLLILNPVNGGVAMNKPFVFVGSGLGYLWLLIWTTVVSIITVGLFFPWAYSAQQRWICANTYVEGRRLRFDGTGLGFFFQWLVIMLLTAVTFGIYAPWGYCQFKRWETRNTVFDD